MPRHAGALTLTAFMTAFCGCATPVAPSGGPPDETPPEVLETRPARGAVNVVSETMRITFSEHVDVTTLPRALSISPAFAQPLDFSWSGRSVVVRFPEPLRENTTYVVTIDTNLRDARRVALRSPIILAFSTGPTISGGILSGRVVAPAAGDPLAGVDVLAYALPDSTAPDSLPDRPAYATQTDAEGTFTFEYLTEQFYYVVALEDVNRNRLPDPQEAFAPPPYAALFADSTAAFATKPWVLSRVDTTAPVPVRSQSLSNSRHLILFSEPVRFVDRDSTEWVVVDSASAELVDVRSLYQRANEPRQMFFLTGELDSRRYAVEASSVVDTSGNPVRSTPTYFTPVILEDTLRTRFVDFLPPGLPAGEIISVPRGVEPGVRLNAPSDEALLRSAVSITDSSGATPPYLVSTSNGTDYEIRLEPDLQPGMPFEVAVDASLMAGPDTVFRRTYVRLSLDEVGEITGGIQTNRTASPSVLIELIAVDVRVIIPDYVVEADADGGFVFTNVPAGTYRLRAFVDANSNGRWDPGFLTPYEPGEDVMWRTEPVRVRARWETALPDTLHLTPPS